MINFVLERDRCMDLKKAENKPQLIKSKKRVLKDLDNLITGYMNSPDKEQYKQAANLVYWFKDFNKYTLEKPQFNPNRLLRYSKGQIIKVNLGFNVGNEMGGMHYAIVLDNRNKKTSGTITVIPLTSVKFNEQGEMKKYNEEYVVHLGTEVYDKLSTKFNEHYIEAKKQIEDFGKIGKRVFTTILEKYSVDVEYLLDTEISTEDIFKLLNAAYNRTLTPYKRYKGFIDIEQKNIENIDYNQRVIIKKRIDSFLKKRESEFDLLMSPLSKASRCADTAEKNIEILKKVEVEIDKMKKGSIALVGQITTVSKQRIYDPRTMRDVFPGVKISPKKVKEIDEKIKKLYLLE